MNPSLLKGVHLVILLFGIFFSTKIKAQCTCAEGKAPNELSYTVVVNPTTSDTNSIYFPKFDPEMGSLSCVRLEDTISIVSTLGIRNLADEREYIFRLTVNTSVTGPSLSINDFRDVVYGPDQLGSYGTPTDTITYGPDTVYDRKPNARTNTSNMIPYLGTTGTVGFSYTIGGGAVSLAGGLNYASVVRTTTWGVFKLTYYWCDNSVLAENFKSFSATKHGDVVDLEWSVADDKKSNTYEIQISYDGRNFQKIGERNGNAAEGATAKYVYQYNIDQSAYRKAYFRIRQSSESVSYSAIRAVELGHDEKIQATVYPNPAVRMINLAFREPLNGDFNIRLTNQLGQAVFIRNIKMKNTSSLQLPGELLPSGGVYYVTALEATTGRTFTSKLLFRK